MTLPNFQLSEPVVTSLITLLAGSLNATITALNATVTDEYTVPQAAQFLPFVPIPSTLEGGTPAIGVQRLGVDFPEDLQSVTDAQHEYAVVAIVENPDQQTLAWQLDRMMQAIANTIQADRTTIAGGQPAGVMRTQAGVWSVNMLRVEPGPLLGDLDPTNPAAPPRSYMSWSALVMQSMRREVYG